MNIEKIMGVPKFSIWTSGCTPTNTLNMLPIDASENGPFAPAKGESSHCRIKQFNLWRNLSCDTMQPELQCSVAFRCARLTIWNCTIS